MRVIAVLGLLGLCFLQAAPAGAAGVPLCDEKQNRAYFPGEEDAKAHRAFSMPTLSYPFGTKLENNHWGLILRVGVDETGAVVCHDVPQWTNQQLNDKRRAIINGMGEWRYRPFVRNGKPVPVILQETVPEEEQPEKHVPLPDVPLGQVRITLERQACHGDCPIYSVDISGNGLVTFQGGGYVDVPDEQAYRVPREDVARLVERMRAIDFWSLRPVYDFPFYAPATHVITVKMGAQTRSLVDHVGVMAGMPASVSAFQDEIDKVARTSMWIHLSMGAIDHLEAEGFDFRGPRAGDFLARAAGNWKSKNDQAMLRLIGLGAPIDRLSPPESRARKGRMVIEEALLNRRAILIEPLIARGALQSDGRQDQAKIDAAFRAAIKAGQLTAVKQIWDAAGDMRPALTFDASGEKSDIVLLLAYEHYRKERWDGLAIAQWLAAQGCNLKAVSVDGATLLHRAAEAGDAEFIRYLLAQGLDIATPSYRRTPLIAAADEDTALTLLEAGADPSRIENFRGHAESKHWPRVVAWLNARGR